MNLAITDGKYIPESHVHHCRRDGDSITRSGVGCESSEVDGLNDTAHLAVIARVNGSCVEQREVGNLGFLLNKWCAVCWALRQHRWQLVRTRCS